LSDGISTFEGVWQTVRDRFYDPHLNGLDWPAVRERHRATVVEATSNERLAEVINDMLSELHAKSWLANDPANSLEPEATDGGTHFPTDVAAVVATQQEHQPADERAVLRRTSRHLFA
jgi:hypothetical protein